MQNHNSSPREVLGEHEWRCYIIDPPTYTERMALAKYRERYWQEPQHQVYDLGLLWLGPVPEESHAQK